MDTEWTHISSPGSLNPLRHLGHAIANERRREEARRLGRPQWRDWHRNVVVITNGRLLVFDDTWQFIWYETIYELVPTFDHPQSGRYGLSLAFEGEPPPGLFGPYSLTVALLIEYFTDRFEMFTEHPGFQQWLADLTAEPGGSGVTTA